MRICRVFINPDGSLRVMHPNMKYWDADKCSQEEFCQNVLDTDTSKDPSLAGLQYRDVDVATLPKERSKRHAWRWADNPGVYVDETVPDPPDPRKERLDRIEKATSVDELKAVLKEMVK